VPLPKNSSGARKARAKLAVAQRDGHSQTEIERLRAEFMTERLAGWIKDTISTAPKLNDEQLERLRALLPESAKETK
jgi:hypothetical protein